MKKNSANNFFRNALLNWNEYQNLRQLPWKSERNPYFIWLSEIILQQTRAEQGLPYYLTFKKHYPTIFDLAGAPLDKVLRDWQGLGYYSRARNLHQTAKIIAEEHGGDFPETYEGLIKLQGIGDYTASAIASFAFNKPNAVVDGNVIRVLSRFFGIESPFDASSGKKEFRELATELLGDTPPAAYNQAIMDFGAVICTPKLASCESCPLSVSCFAYQQNLVNDLPVKQKKLKIRNRYFYYLVPSTKSHTWIRRRDEKDIWKGLWEFPVIEKSEELDLKSLKSVEKAFSLTSGSVRSVSEKIVQKLTHQKIQSVFIEVDAYQEKQIQKSYLKTPISELKNYAFPKSILSYIRKKT